MDFEKAYKNLVAKVKNAHLYAQTDSTKSVLEDILPELRESEDERIRKELVQFVTDVKNISEDGRNSWEVRKEDAETCTRFLEWLEKQKENLKYADSIPTDCVSSAKCEDRWHKTANSLPDNGRDVLAKDALGNYLLASFDGAQWFVSVYDEQDHPVLHTPPILEWCDIPSETYKEQKPAECSEKHIAGIFEKVGLAKIVREQGNDELTNALQDAMIELSKVENAEWSEEDELMLTAVIQTLERFGGRGTTGMQIDWLKSLRPYWKPSEDEESKNSK